MNSRGLVIVFSMAVGWPSWTLAASSPAQVCPLDLPRDPAAIVFQASARPSFQAGPCTVSRDCEYAPPASVSCSGSVGCSSGSDPVNGWHGWVQCDSGPYLACSPPPPPQCEIDSCTTTAQCLDICSVELTPSTYECVDDCCVCSYD